MVAVRLRFFLSPDTKSRRRVRNSLCPGLRWDDSLEVVTSDPEIWQPPTNGTRRRGTAIPILEAANAAGPD